MFDPYRKWLGILPKDQPPNCYRLLSLELFEQDLDVIEAAVDRTMGFVRQYQSGEYAAEAASLLNEIARARLCLLKPESKVVYDAKLKSEIGSVQTPVAKADDSEVDWEAVELPESPRRPVITKRKKSKKKASAATPRALGIAAGILALIVLSLTLLTNQRASPLKPNETTSLSKPHEGVPPAHDTRTPIVARNEPVTETVRLESTSSTTPAQMKTEAVEVPNKDSTEQALKLELEAAKKEIAELKNQEAVPANPVAPSPAIPPAESQDPPVSVKVINLLPRGDMEFPGAFKNTFQTVTPDGKPFAVNRWETNPHGGKACLHLQGSYEWACVKIGKVQIPSGKTVHGSMWRRAERGSGNFLINGFKDKVKVLNKEVYGNTGKEWEETHWTLTPEELNNATRLEIEVITAKDFDVFIDDLRIWVE